MAHACMHGIFDSSCRCVDMLLSEEDGRKEHTLRIPGSALGAVFVADICETVARVYMIP